MIERRNERVGNAVTPGVTSTVTSGTVAEPESPCVACGGRMDPDVASKEPQFDTHPACDPTHRITRRPRMAIREHWEWPQFDWRNPWKTTRGPRR
jgi:hypothetical protein